MDTGDGVGLPVVDVYGETLCRPSVEDVKARTPVQEQDADGLVDGHGMCCPWLALWCRLWLE